MSSFYDFLPTIQNLSSQNLEALLTEQSPPGFSPRCVLLSWLLHREWQKATDSSHLKWKRRLSWGSATHWGLYQRTLPLGNPLHHCNEVPSGHQIKSQIWHIDWPIPISACFDSHLGTTSRSYFAKEVKTPYSAGVLQCLGSIWLLLIWCHSSYIQWRWMDFTFMVSKPRDRMEERCLPFKAAISSPCRRLFILFANGLGIFVPDKDELRLLFAYLFRWYILHLSPSGQLPFKENCSHSSTCRFRH